MEDQTNIYIINPTRMPWNKEQGQIDRSNVGDDFET